MVIIERYIEAVREAKNKDDITKAGLSLSEVIGCEYFMYVGVDQIPISTPQLTIIGNYPQAWLQRYEEQQYARIDPTVVHAAYRVTPLFWCDVDMADEEVAAFFRDAGANGIVSGVTIPLHSGRGFSAILTFASSSEGDEVYQRLRANISQIFLFGYHLHDVVIRQCSVSARQMEKAPLTEAERYCLLWAAEGKTAWEIGKIMSIKERTVVFHLANATKKLGAVNRQHAIACAIALGEIRANITTLPERYKF